MQGRNTTKGVDMKQTVYLSRVVPGLSDADRDAILRCSVRNNPQLGITGVLIQSDTHYLQLLEGPEAHIEALLDFIATDPRHTDMAVIGETTTAYRAFPNWAMGSVDVGADAQVMSLARAAADAGRRDPAIADAVVTLGKGMNVQRRAG